MYHIVDATNIDEGPVRDYNIHMSIYYVCFIVIFSFFFINIFVALIIVTFQESGERNIVGCDLDRNQVSVDGCVIFPSIISSIHSFIPFHP